MTKEECEYCADEPECSSTLHNIDCIFCTCQEQYDTNFTCEDCLHDLTYCTCSDAEKQLRLDKLFVELSNKMDLLK